MKSMNNKILPILKTWLEKHSDAADASVRATSQACCAIFFPSLRQSMHETLVLAS